MPCYLLKWSPNDWPAEKFDEYIERYEGDEFLKWACGTTKKILPGDSFFLLKTGRVDGGIIGSGRIVSSPFEDTHYDEAKARNGLKALFVEIKFDYLARPGELIPITRDELDTPELTSNIWSVQGSGKTISLEVATALASLWEKRVDVQLFRSPDELIGASHKTFPEGAKKFITVNAYERNPEARRRCLDHWGYNCTVCKFRFDMSYGPLGINYMHVHHLYPISSIGQSYQVDPIADLRPVCPNCHAMLHRKSPPLSIEELQKIVAVYKAQKISN
jgi:5-methylcytosine-specific restriction enzyme A